MAVVDQRIHSGDSDSSVGGVSEDEQVEQTTGVPLVDGNQGWANVFAKVLTQNPKVKKTKKSLILVKAKKDAELEKQRQLKGSKGAVETTPKTRREPLKIVDKQGNVVDEEELSAEEESSSEEEEEEKEEDSKKLNILEKIRLRKQRMEMGLVLPQAGDPYEKNLLRTATKGVIQLFNAVNKFQEEKKKKRKDEESSDEEGRYKKGRFMETLNKIQEKKKRNEDGQTTSKWEALRDDFMTDSKMRDWDKQDNETDEDDP